MIGKEADNNWFGDVALDDEDNIVVVIGMCKKIKLKKIRRSLIKKHHHLFLFFSGGLRSRLLPPPLRAAEKGNGRSIPGQLCSLLMQACYISGNPRLKIGNQIQQWQSVRRNAPPARIAFKVYRSTFDACYISKKKKDFFHVKDASAAFWLCMNLHVTFGAGATAYPDSVGSSSYPVLKQCWVALLERMLRRTDKSHSWSVLLHTLHKTVAHFRHSSSNGCWGRWMAV